MPPASGTEDARDKLDLPVRFAKNLWGRVLDSSVKFVTSRLARPREFSLENFVSPKVDRGIEWAGLSLSS